MVAAALLLAACSGSQTKPDGVPLGPQPDAGVAAAAPVKEPAAAPPASAATRAPEPQKPSEPPLMPDQPFRNGVVRNDQDASHSSACARWAPAPRTLRRAGPARDARHRREDEAQRDRGAPQGVVGAERLGDRGGGRRRAGRGDEVARARIRELASAADAQPGPSAAAPGRKALHLARREAFRHAVAGLGGGPALPRARRRRGAPRDAPTTSSAESSPAASTSTCARSTDTATGPSPGCNSGAYPGISRPRAESSPRAPFPPLPSTRRRSPPSPRAT
jgi:hypothetical protein